MTNAEERIVQCMADIGGRIPYIPRVALVLGSGLGDFAEQFHPDKVIPYSAIPDFPRSTVEGHRGRFVFAEIDGVRTVMMDGRVHYYEGYSMEDVVLPVRLMRRMGADALILTNAAGGLNPDFEPGSLMMIKDQIASFVPSSLIGPNLDSLGTRFPDMTHIYDETFMDLLREEAVRCGIPLHEGIYIQLSGPNYETPAEVRMCRMLGADAVGMSTACEAIAARHCGFRVMGISCITNPASGLSDRPLSHREVRESAGRASRAFGMLVRGVIPKIVSSDSRKPEE